MPVLFYQKPNMKKQDAACVELRETNQFNFIRAANMPTAGAQIKYSSL